MFCSFFLIRIGLQQSMHFSDHIPIPIFNVLWCFSYVGYLCYITRSYYITCLFVCFYKGGDDSMLSSKTFVYFLYSVFLFFSSCYLLRVENKRNEILKKKKLPHLVYMLCCMHRWRLAVLTSSQRVPRGFFFIYCAASSSERVTTLHYSSIALHTARIYIFIFMMLVIY